VDKIWRVERPVTIKIKDMQRQVALDDLDKETGLMMDCQQSRN
jgi:hypothetical protein